MSDLVQNPTNNSIVLVGSAMTLSVVTTDPQLVALCRDVLRELGDPAGSLEACSATIRSPG